MSSENKGYVVDVDNFPVPFPYETPYECQLEVMRAVHNAVVGKQNALIECPTGTGKTLAVLSMLIALQSKATTVITKSVSSKKTGEIKTKNIPSYPFKIVYATRTHTQIAQVIRELKALPNTNNNIYTKKVCVLGGRERLCCNDSIKSKGNIDQECISRMPGTKGKKKKCDYRTHMMSSFTYFRMGILDIEDAKQICKRSNTCPYYQTRAVMKDANIIVCPYNYVIGKNMFQDDFNFSNCVIIFDEAHNIENYLIESATIEISSTMLTECEAFVNQAIGGNNLITLFAGLQSLVATLQSHGGSYGMDLRSRSSAFQKPLEDNVTAVLSGDGLQELLYKCNIRPAVVTGALDEMKKFNSNISVLFSKIETIKMDCSKIIDSVLTNLALIFGAEAKKYPHLPYYAYIIDQSNKYQTSTYNRYQDSPGQDYQKGPTLVIYTPLPSICFKSLEMNATPAPKEDSEESSFCITNPLFILLSGTLAPLDSYQSELSVPFPIRREGGVSITDSSIRAGLAVNGYIITDAPRYDYNFYTSTPYNLLPIIKSLRSNIGGTLIFLPSFKMLSALTSKITQKEMTANNIILDGTGKKTFKNVDEVFKNGCNLALKKFKAGVTDPNLFPVLVSVARSRVSEGVDFEDHYCRTLIVLGIPFPNAQDMNVRIKRSYMDEASSSGSQWYMNQAMRSVNQCLGRGIRHINDYCTIILLDNRYATENRFFDQLPSWIRPNIYKGRLDECRVRMREWERNIMRDHPKPMPRKDEEIKMQKPENTVKNNILDLYSNIQMKSKTTTQYKEPELKNTTVTKKEKLNVNKLETKDVENNINNIPEKSINESSIHNISLDKTPSSENQSINTSSIKQSPSPRIMADTKQNNFEHLYGAVNGDDQCGKIESFNFNEDNNIKRGPLTPTIISGNHKPITPNKPFSYDVVDRSSYLKNNDNILNKFELSSENKDLENNIKNINLYKMDVYSKNEPPDSIVSHDSWNQPNTLENNFNNNLYNIKQNINNINNTNSNVNTDIKKDTIKHETENFDDKYMNYIKNRYSNNNFMYDEPNDYAMKPPDQKHDPMFDVGQSQQLFVPYQPQTNAVPKLPFLVCPCGNVLLQEPSKLIEEVSPQQLQVLKQIYDVPPRSLIYKPGRDINVKGLMNSHSNYLGPKTCQNIVGGCVALKVFSFNLFIVPLACDECQHHCGIHIVGFVVNKMESRKPGGSSVAFTRYQNEEMLEVINSLMGKTILTDCIWNR